MFTFQRERERERDREKERKKECVNPSTQKRRSSSRETLICSIASMSTNHDGAKN